MRASCLGHCLFFRDDKITACFNGFSGVVKFNMAPVLCPRNQTEWEERSKHCVSNEQSYHCLPDEYGNLVNACVDPVWIQPGKICRTAQVFLQN